VSVTANAIHAVVAADADVPRMLAASVAAVPPVVLLAITHLTVILTRTADPATALAAAAESMPALPSGESQTSRRDDGVADRRALGWELREAGWSNKRIARELGVHPSTVGRWFAVAHLTDTTDTADEREETTP
jgi:DNA-binding NarL/FixJ family response regulator